MNPFDPTVVHSGECRTCYGWVRDNETMTDGECISCTAASEEDLSCEPVFDREVFDLKVKSDWELS